MGTHLIKVSLFTISIRLFQAPVRTMRHENVSTMIGSGETRTVRGNYTIPGSVFPPGVGEDATVVVNIFGVTCF